MTLETDSLADKNAASIAPNTAKPAFDADFERDIQPQIEKNVVERLRRDDKPGRKFLAGTVVVRETVCGRGLFAERSFAKNVPVGRVRGIIVDDNRYSSDYCVDAGGSLTLEPGAPFCYLNHSCEPNCAFFRYSGPDDEEPDADAAENPAKNRQNGEAAQNNADFVVEDCARKTCVGCEDAKICDSFDPKLGKLDANFPIWRDDDVEIWVETLRPVAVGEELTSDYSWGLDRAIRCDCGSPNCRGWIVEAALLPRLLATQKSKSD